MTTFTLFRDLPVELRLKIWGHTFPGPRNVGVKIRFKEASFGGWMSRKNNSPPPMALQVCQESREEALKYYILSFGTAVEPPTIYFNYQIDTLCFGDGPNALSLFPERENQFETGASDYLLNIWSGKSENLYGKFGGKPIHTKEIRRIYLDVDESIYGRRSFCWEEVRRLDGLEELLIVIWDPEDRAEELMTYFRTAMNDVTKAFPEWVVPKTEVVSALSGRNWGSIQPNRADELA